MNVLVHTVRDWPFWVGVVLAPFFYFAAYRVFKFVFAQYKGCKKWCLGLSLVQYPAMWMVSLGLKVLNKKHCKMMRYEERWYVSPMVEAFAAPAGSPDMKI